MMGSSDVEEIPSFIERVVNFEDGTSYRLLRPITNFMSCHDGSPQEARMVFTCKRIAKTEDETECVMKVKIQEINLSSVSKSQAQEGPSTTTKAELEALEKLKDNPYTPQLIAWKRGVQGEDGPLPGGYVTYMLMTKLPGDTLFNTGYREMLRDKRDETVAKRDTISKAFLKSLQSLYAAGIEPMDCGLRNLLWDEQDKKCGIIDFEIWRERSSDIENEKEELMRWGLVERPPPLGREHAWAMQWR